ncbi:hypothetical protein HF325_002838 [Metschnikowia pulcherrima]|uniref:Alkaline phosphatase n=1 Tax=Metschnikowia pulcherrima TaxID=27326 RepID=A0A8H7LBI7_9ASCO|nr:hypothetical protein HF325_002838 [Metschnikowia pulcherrima]
MVTDGMGPASLLLARSFKQHRDQLDLSEVLNIDKHFIGTSRTRSNDSLVTDSAAGATAFSCGLKSYNGAIGVDSDKNPCGTILEALKLQGYLTGLVVTTRITDATPAAFSAHVDYRFQEDLIAEQQLGGYSLGRQVDLILGGGRCHFLPSSVPGGCRADDRNLIEEAVARNYSYVGDRAGFDALNAGKNVTLPLLGLLARTDIPYDIDRDATGVPLFGRTSVAYDAAYKKVLDFIDSTDVPTVAISTSDHETGGLVTARQVTPNYPDYLWYPSVLLNCTHSGEYLTRKVFGKRKQVDTQSAAFTEFIAKEIVEADMGILDYTQDEIDQIRQYSARPEALLYFLNNMVSARSQTGWTTHGHSAVDVNIYAYSNSEYINDRLYRRDAYTGLLGNHENIEIGTFMETLTGVNLKEVTELVRDTKHSPGATFDATAKHSMFEHALEL